MVGQNVVTRKKVQQRRSAAQEQQARALMAAAQNTLNMVLWQMAPPTIRLLFSVLLMPPALLEVEPSISQMVTTTSPFR